MFINVVDVEILALMLLLQHEERAFVLKLSAIEIYNEAIRDLLSMDSTPLRLLDDPEVKVFLPHPLHFLADELTSCSKVFLPCLERDHH